MPDTPSFFLLLGIWTGAAAAAMLALRSRRAAGLAAGGFLALCAIPAAAVLLVRVGVLAGVLPDAPATEGAYALARWPVLGVAAAGAVLSLRGRGSAACLARSPLVLRGLCLFTALGYLAIEAGKLAHDAEMREFFTGSGYPVVMMYAVMAAETLGAVGLLVPRTRLPAAAGLSVLMLGAIGTHLKNGDPLSDSLDAVRFLVLLAAIAALVRAPRRGEVEGRPSIASPS